MTLATLVSVVKTVIAFEMMLSSRSYVELVAPRDSWRLRLTLRYEWRVVKATTATHAPQRRDHGIQVGRSGEPDENSGAISLENRFDVCSSLMDAVALRFPHRVLDRAGHRSQLHGA